MGYRQTSPRRNSGQRQEIPRHEKDRAKAMGQKHRSSGSYAFEEKHVPTSEEVAEKTLKRLRILGNQNFALSPYSEHFNRWLMNLKDVLSEFESSPAISMDEDFVKECSQILSSVHLELEERRRKETSGGEIVKDLSDKRMFLGRIEEEHASKTKAIKQRKDSEIKYLSSNIDGLRKELDHIVRMKAGIFRVISKKARTLKEAEATQRLNAAQIELDKTVQNFTAEQERLREEYETKKQSITEQIRRYQKEIENQEIDDSIEARRAACEALVNAVNALLQRKSLNLHET